MKWFTNIMVDLKWFKKKNYRDILMQIVDNTGIKFDNCSCFFSI